MVTIPSDTYSLRFLLVLVGVIWCIEVYSAGPSPALPSDIQCQSLREQKNPIKPEIEGWCLLIERSKGNCLACHHLDVEPWPRNLAAPGNIATSLTGVSIRFPDRLSLKRMIYDPSLEHPLTIMPLYGKHKILGENEIDLVAEFLMTQ